MVNNIMAAMKTAGSTKTGQSQSSKKTSADNKSVFTQALSNAASAANATDIQTTDKKTYDKKDTSDKKDSTGAVQEKTDEKEAVSDETVVGQEAFLSTMQMGADNSQMIDVQNAWNQTLAETDGNLEAVSGELVSNVGADTQIETLKTPADESLVSGEIPVELTEQPIVSGTLSTQTDSESAGQMSSMNTGEKLSAGKEVSKKDETEVVDVKAEAVVSRTDLSRVHGQGNSAEPIQAEVEVTETGDIRQDYADMIKDMIAKQIANGKQELEISLTPRNLGELLVRVAYDAGETTVSIICNNAKTMQAMSSRAGELGKVLETTLGDKMDVVVEQKEQNGSHLYEDGKNGSGAQAQKEELERREAELRKRLEKESASADFLQQLRLGLT